MTSDKKTSLRLNSSSAGGLVTRHLSLVTVISSLVTVLKNHSSNSLSPAGRDGAPLRAFIAIRGDARRSCSPGTRKKKQKSAIRKTETVRGGFFEPGRPRRGIRQRR